MASEPQPIPGPEQIRASNADRERVAAVLTDAMAQGRLTPTELEERLDIVYGAKTLGELVPVTRDLPVPGHVTGVPAAMPAPLPVAGMSAGLVGGQPTSRVAFAVMGGSERKGEWVVARQFTAIAIMGGVELDLSEAGFEDYEVTITAVAVMGGIDITVPDDVEVRSNGIGIMGGFDHRVPPATAGSGQRRILRVNGAALMGGVDIHRMSDKQRRELEARRRGQ